MFPIRNLLLLLLWMITVTNFVIAENVKEDAKSRKILGSSVVTSVSVIMDTGKETHFSDAVGKPQKRPPAASHVASPINLLNPDRYEFYTFNDQGDLVKRLMTLQEIQGIIASGDSEGVNTSLNSNINPAKKVDDIVNNVQNVLHQEMSKTGSSSNVNEHDASNVMLDTPDVSNTWSMILPAVFGNSGEEIKLNKPVVQKPKPFTTLRPEEITITAKPTFATTSGNKITVFTDKNQDELTTKIADEVLKTDAPVITVAIITHPDESATEKIAEVVKSTKKPVLTATIADNNGMFKVNAKPSSFKPKITKITTFKPVITTGATTMKTTTTTSTTTTTTTEPTTTTSEATTQEPTTITTTSSPSFTQFINILVNSSGAVPIQDTTESLTTDEKTNSVQTEKLPVTTNLFLIDDETNQRIPITTAEELTSLFNRLNEEEVIKTSATSSFVKTTNSMPEQFTTTEIPNIDNNIEPLLTSTNIYEINNVLSSLNSSEGATLPLNDDKNQLFDSIESLFSQTVGNTENIQIVRDSDSATTTEQPQTTTEESLSTTTNNVQNDLIDEAFEALLGQVVDSNIEGNINKDIIIEGTTNSIQIAETKEADDTFLTSTENLSTTTEEPAITTKIISTTTNQDEKTTTSFDDLTTTTDYTTETPTTEASRTTIFIIRTTNSLKPDSKKDDVTETSTNSPSTETVWSLVPTLDPNDTKTTNIPTTVPKPDFSISSSSPVELHPTVFTSGLDDTTQHLDADVASFITLCNELAFGFWNSITSKISSARSVFVSPFAATSLLAMVFLGARGATSGEMNEILKLDDVITFNPHLIFKNVTETIKVKRSNKEATNVANSVILRQLYSDKSKGKLLSFYKERVRQFYDGHVEEVSFKEVGDLIRRRTNLLVKRRTNGKVNEFVKDLGLNVRPPLAGVSASIFQTDCSSASTVGRDGELYFVVLPTIRQRRLIPIPAVVYRNNFLAGYDPLIDATAVSLGSPKETVSTIFVIPGQQGIAAPGDGLSRLESQLLGEYKENAWRRLLRSLIPRPGLEVQLPRFSHRSVLNASVALKNMGMKDLFNPEKADLRGLNGVANDLFLSDILQINLFSTCGEELIGETHHTEIYPATANLRRNKELNLEDDIFTGDKRYGKALEYDEVQRAFHDPLHDPRLYDLPLPLRPRQARLPSEAPRLRFDRPFLYFVRHNPTGLILHMGRFNPRLLP